MLFQEMLSDNIRVIALWRLPNFFLPIFCETNVLKQQKNSIFLGNMQNATTKTKNTQNQPI